MRMWMIPTQLLCRKHLLGEHSEIHKHKHNFVKGHSMQGRIYPVVKIEPSAMQSRHDDLAAELLARGYNHNSPFEAPSLDGYALDVINAKVNHAESYIDLIKRCPDCKQRINNLI